MKFKINIKRTAYQLAVEKNKQEIIQLLKFAETTNDQIYIKDTQNHPKITKKTDQNLPRIEFKRKPNK